MFGGYATAASWAAGLARRLPMSKIDATMTATMLSFAIYASIVVIVFAVARVRTGAILVAAGMASGALISLLGAT